MHHLTSRSSVGRQFEHSILAQRNGFWVREPSKNLLREWKREQSEANGEVPTHEKGEERRPEAPQSNRDAILDEPSTVDILHARNKMAQPQRADELTQNGEWDIRTTIKKISLLSV